MMIFPRFLRIDISSHCNYQCPFCTYRDSSQEGFMSLELFKRLTAQLKDFPSSLEVSLFTIGEPLLHPEFTKIIQVLAEDIKDQTATIATNLSLLDEEKTDAILKSGAFRRVFASLDAVNTETYEKMRVGGDYSVVLKNLIRFIERRKELKMDKPFLDFQFLVSPVNFAELTDFIVFWKETLSKYGIDASIGKSNNKGDRIVPLLCIVPDVEGQEKSDSLFKEAVNNEFDTGFIPFIENPEKKRQPCAMLYDLMAVDFRGLVTPCCCGGKEGNFLVGDASESSMLDIWNGEVMNSYRSWDLAGQYDDMPICRECFQTSRDLIDPCCYLADEVIQSFKKQYKEIPEMYFSKGMTFFKNEDYVDAIHFFRKAVEFNPWLTEPRKHLAISLQIIGEFQEALEIFSKLVCEYPKDWVSLKGMGFCLQLLGEVEESEKIFKKLDQIL